MELELGLKITHTRDDITSTADLRIAKDPFGPVFLSRETDQMFILIAHLKGFRRENIFVEINKDGNRIAISGEKPVQEMVMIGWIMCKKQVDIKAFRKVFPIPDVVDLERIKAKYNEQESTLRIIMKKKVKGICGFRIEEETEEPEPEEEDEEEEEEQERKMINEDLPKEYEEIPKVKLVEKKEPEQKQLIEQKKKPEKKHSVGKKEPKEKQLVEKKEPEKKQFIGKKETKEKRLVEQKEPEKKQSIEFVEEKESEEEKLPKLEKHKEIPKVEEVIEDMIQSSEGIDQRQGEAYEEVGGESKFERKPEESESEKEKEKIEEQEETEEVENQIFEEPEEVMRKEPEEPEVESVEETNQVLERPKELPIEKVVEPGIMEAEIVELEPEKIKVVTSTEKSKEKEEVMRKELEIETVDEANKVLERPEEHLKEKVTGPGIMEAGIVEYEPEKMKTVASTEKPEEKEPPDEIQKVEEVEEEPLKEETEDATQQQSEIPNEVEGEKIENKDDQAQDLASEKLEDHESGEDVDESSKEPEPDQKSKEDGTPTLQLEDASDKQQVAAGEIEDETENMEGEIEEETDEEEQNGSDKDATSSPEMDADKGPIEGSAMEEDKPKKSKLRKPLMFAGSAFLVSLFVLVINLLRQRKR